VNRLVSAILAVPLLMASVCTVQGEVPSDKCVRLVMLKDEAYGNVLMEHLRKARREIIVCSYIFRITDSPRNRPIGIARELIQARKRGVKVKVFLERNSDDDRLNRENSRTAAMLSNNGIEVLFDSPDRVAHLKVVLIDGRYVFTGSHNLTQGALEHNREVSVLIDSPETAADLRKYVTEFGSAPASVPHP
jgi:phosphatidylserine/phosphatidylglycerophosphate/cardiolipin synthase-like enzyme